MFKKILFSIIILVIIIFSIELSYVANNKKEKEEEIIQNNQEISYDNESVQDDCINEWDDYAEEMQKEIKKVSQMLVEDNNKYVVKNIDNVIKVYYIDDNNEEILYKETQIPIEYLEKEDIEKLKYGIYVEGIQELNKLMEDFE